MDIKPSNAGYGIEEYRCLVINNNVVTTSLYTDMPRTRSYSEVNYFANDFVHTFKYQLPNSYDLDICRLTNGELAVVELNDISGCGFFADHDLPKLFKSVYRFAQRRLCNH
jgi:hypothetical protein